MKAKHWLISGVGCISAGILVGVALGLYWLGQVRSFASSGGTAEPTQGFSVVMVGAALANLLLMGGIVLLVVGFIKLAKEPSGVPRKPPRGWSDPAPSSEHRGGHTKCCSGPGCMWVLWNDRFCSGPGR